MGYEILQIDAFTDEPFKGNPAAVCLLAGPADEVWMQRVAAEMNLSETAFVHAAGDGFALRWFTPTTEVKLCGHATLATAHALWQRGCADSDQTLQFDTLSGTLTAVRRGEWIELDFPAEPDEPIALPAGLAAALGVQPVYVGRNRWTCLVEVDGESVVREMTPDFGRLNDTLTGSAIVTSRCESGPYDFVSRFFAPAVGIDEDPVTGAAHCCLGPYWQRRLGTGEFTACQASRRGGVVRVRMQGDRVILGGQAVTVFRGELEQLKF